MSSAPRRCHADVGDAEGFTHGGLRIWAMGSLSAASLARQGARVAHVFVATSVKDLRSPCTASPVRTPPPSQVSIEGTCSSTSAPTVLPAAVSSQHAHGFMQPCRPPVTGRMFSTLKVVASRRPAAWSFIDENVGPALRCLGACRAERCYRSRLRGDGGGVRTRLPCPVASKRSPIAVLTGSSVTPTRSRPLTDDRCWTQRRPPAGPSR